MNNYPATLAINTLRLPVHLGVGAGEREKPQPIELDIRLYFPEPPASMADDHNPHFICYDVICQSLIEHVKGKEFRLIEYLTMECYRVVRAQLETMLGQQAASRLRLWIRLCKCSAPVPYMIGGASFIFTDFEDSVVEAH